MTLARRHILAAAASLRWVAAAAESLPDLVARAKQSVVLVGSYGLMDSPRFGFRGTGFVIAGGRHVITNAHVIPPELAGRVDRSLAVQVWTPDSQWIVREAKLQTLDTLHDLALLQIDGPPLPALRMANDEAREGTAIAIMGFPLGSVLGYSHVTHLGIVSARSAIVPPATYSQGLNARAVKQLRQGNFGILQLDVTAYPGNSGGPVFDVASGEVVGIVSMVLVKGTRESALSAPTGISYAVPVVHARELLEEDVKTRP